LRVGEGGWVRVSVRVWGVRVRVGHPFYAKIYSYFMIFILHSDIFVKIMTD